jgi:hypothetical protein
MCNDLDWRDMLGATAARVTRARYALDAIVPLELDAHRLALSIGSSKTSLRAAG